MKLKWIYILLTSLLIPNKIFAQNFILEANPLLIINQGFGLSAEYLLNSKLSIGSDISYFNQTPYDLYGVTAKRVAYEIGLKTRYYFKEKAVGPFTGLKISFLSYQSSISDNTETVNNDGYFIAPIIQGGYRFLWDCGFTLSVYVGIGYKSKSAKFTDSMIPVDKQSNVHWVDAQTNINKGGYASSFQPDYGITFGYSL